MTFKLRLEAEIESHRKSPGRARQTERGGRAEAQRQRGLAVIRGLCGWSLVITHKSGARSRKAWDALVRSLDFTLYAVG